MNKQSELNPLSLAWRGALAAIVGPVGMILLISTEPGQALIVIYLLPMVLIAGSVGTVVGFVVGLMNVSGSSTRLSARLLVSLGVSTVASSVLVFVLVIRDRETNWLSALVSTMFLAVIIGLLPGVVTTPRGLFKRRKGEVQ